MGDLAVNMSGAAFKNSRNYKQACLEIVLAYREKMCYRHAWDNKHHLIYIYIKIYKKTHWGKGPLNYTKVKQKNCFDRNNNYISGLLSMASLLLSTTLLHPYFMCTPLHLPPTLSSFPPSPFFPAPCVVLCLTLVFLSLDAAASIQLLQTMCVHLCV